MNQGSSILKIFISRAKYMPLESW